MVGIPRILKKKWHFYSFAFSHSDGKTYTAASAYIGLPNRKITMSRIRQAKEAAGVDGDAVMTSCCYLGKMTSEEMGKAEK